MDQTTGLSRADFAILKALVTNSGRILSRKQILQFAGLVGVAERRCDASLVTLRRELGVSSVITVRGRGWMLHPDAMSIAQGLLAAVAQYMA